MIFTRPMFAIACSLFISLSIAACAKATGGGPVDNGDGGDDGWTSNTSSKASSGTGTGGGGTGGSGGGVEPPPPSTCSTNSIDCASCNSCSTDSTMGGQCESYYLACSGSQECIDYDTCIGGCTKGDTACFDSCDATYPSGSQTWLTFASCVVCLDCFSLCDGATACK